MLKEQTVSRVTKHLIPLSLHSFSLPLSLVVSVISLNEATPKLDMILPPGSDFSFVTASFQLCLKLLRILTVNAENSFIGKG